jgi:hypothetical protein
LKAVSAAAVPAEAGPANDLLRNAINLATRAAEGRLKAIAAGNMQLAWEASSAASGALLLFERAAAEMNKLTAAPAAR